jgi:hypothetical protein
MAHYAVRKPFNFNADWVLARDKGDGSGVNDAPGQDWL